MKIRLFFALFIFVIGFNFIHAQKAKYSYDWVKTRTKSDSTVFSIQLEDNTILICTVSDLDSSNVWVKTLGGIDAKLSYYDITSIRKIKGEWKEEGFRQYNPHASHMFLSSTASKLPGGSGYFSTVDIFFPLAVVGITDYISVGAGFPVFPGTSLGSFYGFARVNLGSFENLNFALSSFAFLIDETTILIPQAIVTAEFNKLSLTFSVGNDYGFFRPSESLLYTVGAMFRVGSGYLISENWILPDSDFNVYSIGIRIMGDNVAGDLGFIKFGNINEGFPLMPWLGLFLNF